MPPPRHRNQNTNKKVSDENKFLEKNGLKNFNRTPIVCLQRHNIIPYLKKLEKPALKKICTLKITNFKVLPPNLFQSKVKLTNDNLEQLKLSLAPNYSFKFKCKICELRYPDEEQLRSHHDGEHLITHGPLVIKPQKRVSFSDQVIVHEMREYHRCRKCTRIFDSYINLKKHTRKSHMKRTCFICYYCSLTFADRNVFKVHIKLHCDKCHELFPNKAKTNEHKKQCKAKFNKPTSDNLLSVTDSSINSKQIFEDVKENNGTNLNENNNKTNLAEDNIDNSSVPQNKSIIKNNGSNFTKVSNEVSKINNATSNCQNKNSADNLNDGNTEANDLVKNHDINELERKEKLKPFSCDICNKDFINKCELMHHVTSTHFEETDTYLYAVQHLGNTVIFLCRFCKETFLTLNMIENHVQNYMKETILNKAKELFYCEACPEKFEHETLLFEHKFSHIMNGVIKPMPDVIPTQFDNTKSFDSTVAKRSKSFEQLNQTFLYLNGNVVPEKPIVHPISKKTLLSKFQCSHCGNFLSSKYKLRKHLENVHKITTDLQLQCRNCEESFMFPSLLKSHKCIRDRSPEMPFEDSRPEIMFDNINLQTEHLQIDCFPHDFVEPYETFVEIEESPETSVLSTEQNGGCTQNGGGNHIGDEDISEVPILSDSDNNDNTFNIASKLSEQLKPLQSLGYDIVVDEVPIEF